MKMDDITRQRFENMAVDGEEIYPLPANTNMETLINHVNKLAAHIVKIEKQLKMYPIQETNN